MQNIHQLQPATGMCNGFGRVTSQREEALALKLCTSFTFAGTFPDKVQFAEQPQGKSKSAAR